MPYVLFSHYMGKFVSKVDGHKVYYNADIEQAKVYRSKAGALNAVGEQDTSKPTVFGKVKKKLPTHFEILPVRVYQGEISLLEKGEEKEPDVYTIKEEV